MEQIINEILDEVIEHKSKSRNMQVDNKVIKPNHYKAGEFDVISFCQIHNINFELGNVIKYVTRAGRKENNSELCMVLQKTLNRQKQNKTRKKPEKEEQD